MTDISHGYEDLGLLLKDKIGELSTKLSRLQKAQEESSAMMQWLQTMSNTATKWHQAPTPVDTEAEKPSRTEQGIVHGSVHGRHEGAIRAQNAPSGSRAGSGFPLCNRQQVVGQLGWMRLSVDGS